MTRKPDDPSALSQEELEAESALDLPDREAMSVLRLGLEDVGNFAMPINQAIAANNYTVDSVAMADADQVVIIDQDLDG